MNDFIIIYEYIIIKSDFIYKNTDYKGTSTKFYLWWNRRLKRPMEQLEENKEFFKHILEMW